MKIKMIYQTAKLQKSRIIFRFIDKIKRNKKADLWSLKLFILTPPNHPLVSTRPFFYNSVSPLFSFFSFFWFLFFHYCLLCIHGIASGAVGVAARLLNTSALKGRSVIRGWDRHPPTSLPPLRTSLLDSFPLTTSE